jgi:hypothetical protein
LLYQRIQGKYERLLAINGGLNENRVDVRQLPILKDNNYIIRRLLQI